MDALCNEYAFPTTMLVIFVQKGNAQSEVAAVELGLMFSPRASPSLKITVLFSRRRFECALRAKARMNGGMRRGYRGATTAMYSDS